MALSSQDAHVAAEFKTCGDADDGFVDGKRRRVYVSCGGGVVDVLERREAGYGRLALVPSASGARTFVRFERPGRAIKVRPAGSSSQETQCWREQVECRESAYSTHKPSRPNAIQAELAPRCVQ